MAAGLLAALGWVALLLQAWLAIPRSMAAGNSAAAAIVWYFSYFTILTNTLAAALLTLQALASSGHASLRCAGPALMTGTAAALTLVGVAYELLLRRLWQPEGAQWLADTLLHDAMPLLFLVYWARCVPKRTLRPQAIPGWLVYPSAYLGYALLRGKWTGRYPYPFLDVAELGWQHVLVNALGLLVALLAIGAVLYVLDGRLAGPVSAAAARSSSAPTPGRRTPSDRP